MASASTAGVPADPHGGTTMERFARAQAVMADSQAAVDALAGFLAARAELESMYAKNLQKLAKMGLDIRENSIHPAVEDAIASLRGDVSNECVQHNEMAANIRRDVLDPLKQLKTGNDMVTRVTGEAKRALREVRVAYDRCKKLYTRYYMLHRKASVACTAAGVTPPALWAPRSGAASTHKTGERALSPTPEVSASSHEPDTPVLQASVLPSPVASTIDPRGVPIPSDSEASPEAAASAHERLLATETNFGSPGSLPGSLMSPEMVPAGNSGVAVCGGAMFDADARASRASRGSLGSADDRSRAKLVDVDALHERVGSSKHESPSVEPAFPMGPPRTSAESDEELSAPSAVARISAAGVRRAHCPAPSMTSTGAIGLSSPLVTEDEDGETAGFTPSLVRPLAVGGAGSARMAGAPITGTLHATRTMTPPASLSDVVHMGLAKDDAAAPSAVATAALPLGSEDAAPPPPPPRRISMLAPSVRRLSALAASALPKSVPTVVSSAPVPSRTGEQLLPSGMMRRDSFGSHSAAASEAELPTPSADQSRIRRAGSMSSDVTRGSSTTGTGLFSGFSDFLSGMGVAGGDDMMSLDGISRQMSAARQYNADADSFDDGSASLASSLEYGSGWGSRLRSMWSGGWNPNSSAHAQMSTAERMMVMRGAVMSLVEAAENCRRECEEAWEVHARAKAVFEAQVSAASRIFIEIHKQRMAEMCDSMRKFTIFASSMLANLQYDVQRLFKTIEDAGITAGEVVDEVQVALASPVILNPALLNSAEAALLQVAGPQPPTPNTIAAGLSLDAIIDSVQNRDRTNSGGAHAAQLLSVVSPMPSVFKSRPHSGSDAASTVSGVSGTSGTQVAARGQGGRRASLFGLVAPAADGGVSTPPRGGGDGGVAGAGSAPPAAFADASLASPSLQTASGTKKRGLFSRLLGTGGSKSAQPAVTVAATSAESEIATTPASEAASEPAALATVGGDHHVTTSTMSPFSLFGASKSSRGTGHSPHLSSTSVRSGMVGAGAHSASQSHSSLVHAAVAGEAKFTPGVIEHFVAAVFDPDGKRIPLSVRSLHDLQHLVHGTRSTLPPAIDVTTTALSNAAEGSSDDSSSPLSPIAVVSLADFAAGAAVPQAKPTRHHHVDGATPVSQAAASPPAAPAQAAGNGGAPLDGSPMILRSPDAPQVHPLVPALMADVEIAVQNLPDGIERMVAALDTQRAEGVVTTPPAFRYLCHALMSTLDCAKYCRKYKCVRAIMVISQTFYCHRTVPGTPIAPPSSARSGVDAASASEVIEAENAEETVSPSSSVEGGASALAPPPKVEKVYLQAKLRAHPIWHDMAFWETAVYETVGSEMAKIQADTKNERTDREHEVVFGQLRFFAFNMLNFDVATENVRLLLDKYGKLISLSPAEFSQLHAVVDSLVEERARARAAQQSAAASALAASKQKV